MPSLKDRTVLVIGSGSGSGIARAIALAVGEAGGRVVAAAALAALTNGFLTGVSLPVDGGEHLV
jgi:NAD(P)-dependent dehydrogenase (short-subunit alcohol dehydrogenase family)